MSKQPDEYSEQRFSVTIIVNGVEYIQDSFLASDTSEAIAYAAFRAHMIMAESDKGSDTMERYAKWREIVFEQTDGGSLGQE